MQRPVNICVQRFVQLVTASAVIAGVAGCGGAVIETQPQRRAFLDDKIKENIAKATQCDKTSLSFRETKRLGTRWYDVYTLEGCSQKTDYMTSLNKQNDWITWQYGVAPQPEELREATKTQLKKTAEFDLDCKANMDFEILNEVLDPMHVSMIASVGVRGCGKKSTYRTSCVAVSYQQGKHDIKCTSVITSASDHS